ncbi:MAG: hypothetical protein U0V72_01650 [Cytophagales bacterium]
MKNLHIQTSTSQNILRIVLGILMLTAAVGHFTWDRITFQAQVPNWIPLDKDVVVILSGIVELSLGLAMLFWQRQKIWVGITLTTFYMLIFPGNIAQYVNHTNAFGLNTDTARFIRLLFQPVLVLWALWSTGALDYLRKKGTYLPESFHELFAADSSGKMITFNEYKEKVVLIVNTATKCGLAPQFDGLEALHQKYKDHGLVVLGFPCSQFANQELHKNSEIENSCRINFGVTFKLFSKIDVNGKNTNLVYKFLKSNLGGFLTDDIKWNFTKFIVDKNGIPVKRFSPTTKPEELEEIIIHLLNS